MRQIYDDLIAEGSEKPLSELELRFLQWRFSEPKDSWAVGLEQWEILPSLEEVKGLLELAQEYPEQARIYIRKETISSRYNFEAYRKIEQFLRAEEKKKAEADAKSRAKNNELWFASPSSPIPSYRKTGHSSRHSRSRRGKNKS